MDLVIDFLSNMTIKKNYNQVYFLLMDLVTNIAITY